MVILLLIQSFFINNILQVLRINPRLASVSILCVGAKALKDPFNGIIRYDKIIVETLYSI